jgi:membrane-associated phospholipid phosphatase
MPASVRQRYVRIGLLFYVAWVAVFILEGFYATILPTSDPTIWIDRQIPVVPQFVWVYVSCYIFPFVLLVITSNWHRFNLALLAILLCTLVAFIGHLAYPVAFERPILGSSLSARLLEFIYANDFKPGAQNFPSLHVAIAWIVAFASRGQGLRKIAEHGILLYALLIIASTVLIKQHLVLDLLGGTFLAFIVWPLLKGSYDRSIPAGQEPLGALFSMLRTLTPLLVVCGLSLLVVIVAREFP